MPDVIDNITRNYSQGIPEWFKGFGNGLTNLSNGIQNFFDQSTVNEINKKYQESHPNESAGPSWSDPFGLNYSQEQQDKIDNAAIVRDNSSSEVEKLAKELGMNLTPETLDYLYEYMLNEKSAENAYNRSLQADSEKYQRAVKDLQKAGINPFLAIQGLSAGSVSSPSASVSGGYATSRKNAQLQANTQNSTKWLSVIAMIAMAVISTL